MDSEKPSPNDHHDQHDHRGSDHRAAAKPRSPMSSMGLGLAHSALAAIRPQGSARPSFGAGKPATSRMQSKPRPVNALQMGEEEESISPKKRLRTPSPCSSQSPEKSPGRSSKAEESQSPVKPPAKDKRLGYKAAPARQASSSRSRSRSSSSSVERARSVTPGKVEVAVVNSPVEESGSSSGGFQQVVLERLRLLCKDIEGAEVLAEYIVAMVAGNKSRHDVATELEPFFEDFAQANNFAQWVEEVKVKFLTGSPLPKSKGQAQTPPPPNNQLGQRATGSGVPTAGPHVAVTARAVLQPSPSFSSDPPTAVSVSAALNPQMRGGSIASSPQQAVRSVAAASPKVNNKKSLLENMTRQLQTILTKLNDPNMNDETREKYQALAQSVQSQMAKVSGPPPKPRTLPYRGHRGRR